jgi:hypothetical protein
VRYDFDQFLSVHFLLKDSGQTVKLQDPTSQGPSCHLNRFRLTPETSLGFQRPSGQLLLCLSKEVTKSRCTGCRSFDIYSGCGKRHRHRNAASVVLVQTEWEVNGIHPRQPPAMPWANAQKQHQWQEHLAHLHRFRGPTHRGKSERKEATMERVVFS